LGIWRFEDVEIQLLYIHHSTKLQTIKTTNNMKHYLFCILLLLFNIHVIIAQTTGSKVSQPRFPKGAYTISVENGDTIYRYVPTKNELRFPTTNKPGIANNSLHTNAIAAKASNSKSVMYNAEYMDLSHIPTSYGIDNSKDIGEIPISQSSANGALGYNIPIEVYQATNGMNPSVQITYNSMAGNGVAGYGWQIGGLSAISAVNATIYYDGAPSATQCNTLSAYALDGMRFIDLKTGTSSERYYQTEQGNIKVTAYMSAGIMSYFRVYYPNSNVATYGYEGNTSAKVVYPLTKLKDLSGNVISFSYLETNNVYYVSEINYGGREGSSAIGNYAKITFGYEDRNDVTPLYIAGICMKQDKRLKELKTYFNGQLLRTYGLTYTNAVSSLLKQVDCTSNGKSLNPLVFYYGENNQVIGFDKKNIILSSYFSNASVPDLILSKGKFDSYSLNDGLISYPNKNTYGLLTIKKNWLGKVVGYRYGSTYSPDQSLLVYGDLPWGLSIPATLTAESGFQQLIAMDVDGDGKDELVKMNTSDIQSSYEKITYKVYDLVNTYPYLRYSFDTYYGGVVEWSGLYSPAARTILTGDFLGNGKQTILTISYNQNIKGESVQSWATLVDFDNRNKSILYDKACFSLNSYDQVFVMDFDGDGKADICKKGTNSTEVYTFDPNSGSLVQIASYGYIGLGGRKLLLGDVNGDGKTDIVVSPVQGYQVPASEANCGQCDYCLYGIGDACRNPIYIESYYQPGGNEWTVYYSTGTSSGFDAQSMTSVAFEENTKCILQDMNGDGKSDLVVNNNGTLYLYPSVNGKFSNTPESQSIGVTGGTQAYLIPGNVESDYKMSQLFSVCNEQLDALTFTRNISKEQLLTGVVTSTGVVNKHQYCNLQNNYGNYDKGTACSYPYRNLTGNLYLHARADAYLSGNQIASTSSAYTKGVIDLRGKGFLGFEQATAYDNIRNTTATQLFDPANFGVLKSMDAPTASATYNYNVSIASNKIASVTLTNKTENNKLTGTSVSSSYTYDTYGNPTQITDGYSNGYVSTENTYSNMTGTPYKLGVVTKQKVTSFWMGQTLTKTRNIPVYDSNTGLPIVVVNLTNDNAVSSTTYTYQNGLITKESTTNYSSSNKLETSYNYDSFGRLERKTNPLGLYVTYQYNDKGQVSTATDHKNNTTSYEYDGWGRKTKSSYPDGISESTTLRWVGASSPSGTQGTASAVLSNDVNDLKYSAPMSQGGVVTAGRSITLAPGFTYSAASAGNLRLNIDRNLGVSVPSSLSSTSGGSQYAYVAITTKTGAPTTQTYIDALGRDVRSGAMRFDGSYLYSDKEYDSYGRLARASLPFKGSAPTQWNTYNYDSYDRLLSLSYASGKQDSYSYDGLSVTSTLDGIAKTTTKDAMGKVISISDPAGTITYNLRPDGQPSSIVAPGGITTSFEYDGYGRQTSLIDPSAGTRTFGYDAAGNLNSETDALNKVTATTYDAYNRVSNKNVAGELTTSYNYNSDGQLASMNSSNGTGQSYTYDGLMRVTTASETASDGKYMQKGYIYSNGTTSAITYTTPDGTIATENYLYSNGTLSEIKLNGSASVWKLTAENDMGLATGATTGNLTRAYGYDAYGLPTARTVKQGATTLQDFGYSFNAATGNLNWRRDNTRSLQESFSYDNLNRLTGFGGITMTYDTKGNITDHSAVGQFVYHNTAKPYALTGVTPYGSAIPLRNQDITYNAMQRPATIAENGYQATLTYDAGGDRVKMTLAKDGATQLTRYYIGGQYETETGTAGSKEKLYLGGDAYSAAAVYVKENGGSWNIYYICRDYLGSITHVVNAAGSLTQELNYDPWGRLRNPATQVAYTPDSEPILFLSRGYTGHEHLTPFGLINMNARLYDAALGRFLSPDPYVQAPDFSQNFNRYSYCVNNPLKFTDRDGKFFWIPILIGAAINVAMQGLSGNIHNFAGFMVAAGIGGLSGLAGGIAGQAIAGALGSATSLGGSILNGALTGAGGGFAGGFVGGAGNAWANGSGFGRGLLSGLKAGGIGALGGAVIGGITGALQYRSTFGKNSAFQKGCDAMDVDPNAPATASDNALNTARDAWFEDAPYNEQAIASEGSYEQYTMDMNHAPAMTDPMCSDDVFSGESVTYYNKNLAFSSWKRLYVTMGHELVHANQFEILGNLNATYSSTFHSSLGGFNNILELPAYTLQNNMQVNIGMGSFNPMSFNFKGWQYTSYFDKLALHNMPWIFKHLIP
jgi:RHS repeat-associated protein